MWKLLQRRSINLKTSSKKTDMSYYGCCKFLYKLLDFFKVHFKSINTLERDSITMTIGCPKEKQISIREMYMKISN